MADPAQSFPERRSRPEGVGPFQTGGRLPAVGALGVGDRYRLNLRRFENGRFVGLSTAGYDTVSVVNLSSSDLTIELNDGASEFVVPANVTKSFDHAGTYVIDVVNTGASTVASGEVTVEIAKEPFGADEKARAEARRSQVANVVENFTGLRIGDLGG